MGAFACTHPVLLAHSQNGMGPEEDFDSFRSFNHGGAKTLQLFFVLLHVYAFYYL